MADDRRAAADRIAHLLPPRLQDELQRERKPLFRLNAKILRPWANRLDDCAAVRYRSSAPRLDRDDLPGQVDVRLGCREAGEDDVDGLRGRGRPPTPGRGEQPDLALLDGSVQLVERSALRVIDSPGAEEPNSGDSEETVEPDSEGRSG